MKNFTKILFIILSLITYNSSLITYAQNLVPNPSFEEYSVCPDNGSQLERAVDWFVYYISPDYYNRCANFSSGFSIPENWTGHQCANIGNGYIGIYTYISHPNTLFREIIFSELNDTLTIGTKYFISFRAVLSDLSICSNNNIGILFTTSNDSTQYLLNNFSHINSVSIISDKNNWVTISDSFIADSAYKYIFIGNFFDNLSTDTILYSGLYCYSYYYIDDVCVSEDSLTCIDISSEIIDFNTDTTILNQGNCVNYNINTVVNYDYYEWSFDGAIPNTSNLMSPTNICYNDTGQFSVTLIAFNNNGCGDTITKTNYITVNNINSINDLNYSNQLSISPNPFTDKIKIEITDNSFIIQNIKLNDILGKSYPVNIITNNNYIEIKPICKLQTGIYFLNISTDKYKYTNKLIHFTN
ncbi:MAG: T9SS type A sorting domain-containing protein [Bacteroidota bacterium]